MTKFDDRPDSAKRLEQARIARGFKTRKQAADRFGWSLNTLNHHESGMRGFGRKSAEYASAYRVSEAWLLTGEGPMSSKRQAIPCLKVEGNIQAGNWLDVTLIDDDYGDEFLGKEIIPVVRDPTYPNTHQYALRVVGDSMNEICPDGSYAICVELTGSGIPLHDGLIVHVERREGDRMEITLKELRSSENGWVLVPRSTNPRHKPLLLGGDEATEIAVRGIYLAHYKPAVIALHPRFFE